MTVSNASARVLKPLIDALTTTGSGRQEIIQDAHRRGAFKDLRLVNPAIGAIDDGYGEIADYVADHILPMYGRTIYPKLAEGIDIKGRGGHVRRLRSMHKLDPEAAREHVEAALEGGSKEMKVAALACLGTSPSDLNHLLEQAKAKAKDVRKTAIEGLARSTDPAAIEAL